MLPVANRALVRRAADGLAAAGVGRIVVVCTAAASGPVRRALEGGLTATDVQVVEVPRDTGPLGAVLAARELLPAGPVVLHAGDSLVLGDLRTPLGRVGEDGLDAVVVAGPGRGGGATPAPPGAGPRPPPPPARGRRGATAAGRSRSSPGRSRRACRSSARWA